MVSLMNNEMEKCGRKHPMSNLIEYLSICLQTLKKLQINLSSWPVLTSRHQPQTIQTLKQTFRNSVYLQTISHMT